MQDNPLSRGLELYHNSYSPSVAELESCSLVGDLSTRTLFLCKNKLVPSTSLLIVDREAIHAIMSYFPNATCCSNDHCVGVLLG